MRQGDESVVQFIFLAVGLNLFVHLLTAAPWAIALSFLFYFWSLLTQFKSWKKPRQSFVNVLVCFSAVGVYLQFGTLLGEEPSTTLLVIMSGAKLFDLKTRRDQKILIVLCYLLLMSKLIQDQSFFITIFLIFDVLYLTAVLKALHSTVENKNIFNTLRYSIKLFFLGIPIAAILFLVFPRFSFSLGKSGTNNNQSETGFSESLRPGTINELARSTKVAFRVNLISGVLPPISQLYWRGQVLTEGGGLEWNKSTIDSKDQFIQQNNESNERQIIQEIILEPIDTLSLFALDYPLMGTLYQGRFPKKLKANNEFVLRRRSGNIVRTRYIANSTSINLLDNPSKDYLEKLTEINISPSDRLLKLVNDQINKGVKTSEDWLNWVQIYLQKNSFKYSLNPGVISSVDDFIFDKKVGFCEHYAASILNILRIAKIPSRIVVGFHGGRTSLLGDYHIVSYQDAHSWIEVWSALKKSWIRFDPVEFVEPQRILLGGTEYFNSIQSDQLAGLGGVRNWINNEMIRFFEGARLLWDQTESLWINFLLKYDLSFQKDLLANIEEEVLKKFNYLNVLILLSIVLMIYLFYRIIWHYFYVKSLDLFQTFCYKMEQFGFSKRQSEGPKEYISRIEEKIISESVNLSDLIEIALIDRYGREQNLNRKYVKKHILNLKIKKNNVIPLDKVV